MARTRKVEPLIVTPDMRKESTRLNLTRIQFLAFGIAGAAAAPSLGLQAAGVLFAVGLAIGLWKRAACRAWAKKAQEYNFPRKRAVRARVAVVLPAGVSRGTSGRG